MTAELFGSVTLPPPPEDWEWSTSDLESANTSPGRPGGDGEADTGTAFQQAAAAGIQELQGADAPARPGGRRGTGGIEVLEAVLDAVESGDEMWTLPLKVVSFLAGVSALAYAADVAGKALFVLDIVSDANVAKDFLTVDAGDAALSDEQQEDLDALRTLGVLMAIFIVVPVVFTALFMALAKRVRYVEKQLSMQRARYNSTQSLEKDVTRFQRLCSWPWHQWHRMLLACDSHTAGKQRGYEDRFSELEDAQRLQLVNLEVTSRGWLPWKRGRVLASRLPTPGSGTYRRFLTWGSHHAKYLNNHLEEIRGVSKVAGEDAHEDQLRFLRARWCHVHVVSWVLVPIAFFIMIPRALALDIAHVSISLIPTLDTYLEFGDEIAAFSAARVFLEVTCESVPQAIVQAVALSRVRSMQAVDALELSDLNIRNLVVSLSLTSVSIIKEVVAFFARARGLQLGPLAYLQYMMEMGQGEVPLTAIRNDTIQGEQRFKYSRHRCAPLVQALKQNTLIHSVTISGLPQARVTEFLSCFAHGAPVRATLELQNTSLSAKDYIIIASLSAVVVDQVVLRDSTRARLPNEVQAAIDESLKEAASPFSNGWLRDECLLTGEADDSQGLEDLAGGLVHALYNLGICIHMHSSSGSEVQISLLHDRQLSRCLPLLPLLGQVPYVPLSLNFEAHQAAAMAVALYDELVLGEVEEHPLHGHVASFPSNLELTGLTGTPLLTDAGLCQLTALTGLRSLSLAWCDKVSDAGVGHLTALTGLSWLNLAWCNKVSDASVGNLTALTGLSSLDLAWCNKVSDAGVGHLTALTGLSRLDLTGCEEVSDAGVGHLTALTGLSSLNLAWCNKVSDAGVVHLTALTGLSILDLERCNKVSDAGVGHLTALTGLSRLDLRGCHEVSDAGVGHLTALTGLSSLDLTWCKKVSDAGVGHLTTLTGLSSLSLAWCDKVSDARVGHLTALTGLSWLDLSGCNMVTDDVVRQLKSVNGGLVVHR